MDKSDIYIHSFIHAFRNIRLSLIENHLSTFEIGVNKQAI